MHQDAVPLPFSIDVMLQGPKQYGLSDVNASAAALNKVELTEKTMLAAVDRSTILPSTRWSQIW